MIYERQAASFCRSDTSSVTAVPFSLAQYNRITAAKFCKVISKKVLKFLLLRTNRDVNIKHAESHLVAALVCHTEGRI